MKKYKHGKTRYLTGKDPKSFKHLMDPLAKERLKAMKKLKAKLVKKVSSRDYGTKKYEKVYNRYKAVVKGIHFWEKMLEED